MNADFSSATAATLFVTYLVIDVLYALYIIAVDRRQALAAACLTSIIYSLLAFGVITYSKNPLYLLPIAGGAFVGTFLTVTFKK